MNKEFVIQKMKEVEQTQGQTVYEHGLSVQRYFIDLYSHLKSDRQLTQSWRIPEWVYTYKHLILESLVPLDIIHEYTFWHDLGKPFCIEYDTEGKRHFPNHTRVSYDLWMQIDGRQSIGSLILMDMDIHTLKRDGIDEFSTRYEWATLLMVGLCELNSNASMFGGTESVSFKIKYKKFDKLGKLICEKCLDTDT